MHLLVVEDDQKLVKFLREGLEQDGFSVDEAATIAGAEAHLRVGAFDAAIFDINLPDGDGIALLARLRETNIAIPVLVLSARQEVQEKVRALEIGGDDYLTKPFAFNELVARLRALIRRSKSLPQAMTVEYVGIVLDMATRTATFDGASLELQPLEFNLLRYLMENPERVVSKTSLIQSVWKFNFNPSTNIVEARVSKLREKLEAAGAAHQIRAIRGVGYLFSCPK